MRMFKTYHGMSSYFRFSKMYIRPPSSGTIFVSMFLVCDIVYTSIRLFVQCTCIYTYLPECYISSPSASLLY